MNILEQWIEYNQEDAVTVMDALQDNGIISDNSVMPEDVCAEDAEAAVHFLEGGT